jgi:hypothetical protein
MNPAEVSLGSRDVTRNSVEMMSDAQYFRTTGGELVNDSNKWTIRTLMHEYIVPKLKFVTDDHDEWSYPNLSNQDLNSVKIMNVLLTKMNIQNLLVRQKMDFWAAYRDHVRYVINDHRSNVRNKLKNNVLEGK